MHDLTKEDVEFWQKHLEHCRSLTGVSENGLYRLAWLTQHDQIRVSLAQLSPEFEHGKASMYLYLCAHGIERAESILFSDVTDVEATYIEAWYWAFNDCIQDMDNPEHKLDGVYVRALMKYNLHDLEAALLMSKALQNGDNEAASKIVHTMSLYAQEVEAQRTQR